MNRLRIRLEDDRKENLKGKSMKKSFIHGNYLNYYKKRGNDKNNYEEDERLKFLNGNFFRGKHWLDIGCNDGTFTFQILVNFLPDSTLAIDIDEILVKIAISNLRKKSKKYLEKSMDNRLNESFRNCIIVQKDIMDDNLMERKFDVITLFSVSKWIHLNHGDDGILKLFKIIYDHLNPQGIFIFEPQNYSTYAKRKNLSHHIRNNYDNHITLLTENFSEILIDKIGFHQYHELHDNSMTSKGFDRNILYFQK
ncbi:hypothetical protein SNEBB_009298 [Seison nebaliae]|nr:hypothetical protein SNEBB_009298 [Seison nebaliae]